MGPRATQPAVAPATASRPEPGHVRGANGTVNPLPTLVDCGLLGSADADAASVRPYCGQMRPIRLATGIVASWPGSMGLQLYSLGLRASAGARVVRAKGSGAASDPSVGRRKPGKRSWGTGLDTWGVTGGYPRWCPGVVSPRRFRPREACSGT